MNELAPEEKRKLSKAETKQKFGRYWLIYVALIGTGLLSVAAGVMLPFQPDEAGFVAVNAFTVAAAIFYALGFVTNGEGAAYFWFDKLIDHDEDNTWQIVTAVTMLAVSVVTILMTSISAGVLIAYWLGQMEAYAVMPIWAQKWVVSAIPIMWVAHFVAGALFKALSDEASAERRAIGIIRKVKNDIAEEKANSKANWWKSHAPDFARKLGEMEAQQELEEYALKLRKQGSETRLPPMRPAYAQDVNLEEPEQQVNPTPRRPQN